MNSKNKVIDYITIDEVCDIIGIKRNSKAQITRWIKEGKIKGAYKFGNSWAIPVNWVKSECNSRNINWQGVELEENQTGVSLDKYEQITEFFEDRKKSNAVYMQITRKTYTDDYVKFGNTYGLPKK